MGAMSIITQAPAVTETFDELQALAHDAFSAAGTRAERWRIAVAAAGYAAERGDEAITAPRGVGYDVIEHLSASEQDEVVARASAEARQDPTMFGAAVVDAAWEVYVAAERDYLRGRNA